MIQPGDILRKRYQIIRLLGRGGMADVYLARDMRRQIQVAIKVLRPSLADHPGFVSSFSTEARSLVRLRHPNIVRFFALERDGPLSFIVMEFVDGVSLRTEMARRQGPLTLFETTHILRGVAAALAYAHSQGFVHRDVKPGNILLARDGRVLITDFGIAQAANRSGALTPSMGTPAYMSPEQILGQPLDHRVDIYSLGVTLYEMVTWQRPFTGRETGLTSTSTAGRVREAHLRLIPPNPRYFNPELPDAAAQVILRAMEKNPARRWPDAMQMAAAWEQAVGPALGTHRTLAWAPNASIQAATHGGAFTARSAEFIQSLQNLFSGASSLQSHSQTSASLSGQSPSTSLSPNPRLRLALGIMATIIIVSLCLSAFLLVGYG